MKRSGAMWKISWNLFYAAQQALERLKADFAKSTINLKIIAQ